MYHVPFTVLDMPQKTYKLLEMSHVYQVTMFHVTFNVLDISHVTLYILKMFHVPRNVPRNNIIF